MNQSMNRILLWSVGGVHTLISLTAVFLPRWLFDVIASGHPPYNRHFIADSGIFLLFIGLGLILAARDPLRFRSWIGLAVLAGWMHTLNHIYDVAIGQESISQSLSEIVPLTILAALVAFVYWNLGRNRGSLA